MKTLYVHLKNYRIQVLSIQFLLSALIVKLNLCLVFVRSSFEQAVQAATYEHTVGQVMIRSAQPFLLWLCRFLLTEKVNEEIGALRFLLKIENNREKNRREFRAHLKRGKIQSTLFLIC